jgi:hypothetical protein
MVFMEALQHEWRKIPLAGAQALPSGAPRDGSNVWPLPFGPCSFAQINPGLAVADLKPIG